MLELLLWSLLGGSPATALQPVPEPTVAHVDIIQPRPTPLPIPGNVAPKLIENPSTAILALDLATNKTLLQKSPDRAQPLASISKLMTALIILENHDMDEVVTIPLEATLANGAELGLYEYERLTVRTLMQGLLIASGNDAAIALAIHDAGSESAFVKKMNQRAQELGFTQAQFYNASGLDMYDVNTGETIANRMSPRDIAQLARILLKNDFVRETAQKEVFEGFSVDEEFYHEKPTTNQLLGTFTNVKGLKTGYERSAGQCLVALGVTDDGHEILTVVLGSEDRFGETKKLLTWIYDTYTWN